PSMGLAEYAGDLGTVRPRPTPGLLTRQPVALTLVAPVGSVALRGPAVVGPGLEILEPEQPRREAFALRAGGVVIGRGGRRRARRGGVVIGRAITVRRRAGARRSVPARRSGAFGFGDRCRVVASRRAARE